MPVSLETYVLINLLMNFITIGIVARSRGRVRWGAVSVASLFGTLYAVAMQTETFQLLKVWPLRLVLIVLMVSCAMTVHDIRDWMSALMTTVCATLLLGGTQLMLRGVMAVPYGVSLGVGALIGCVVLVAALDHRKQHIVQDEVQLLIRARGRRVHLTALIDTGNRLHEPLSGLPVLIVSERKLRQMLPASLDPMRPERTLPPGFRLAAYGSLGGGGRIAVFRPDELLVSYGDGYYLAPDLWVGVYPGSMPGGVSALAPGVIGTIRAAGRPKMLQMKGS